MRRKCITVYLLTCVTFFSTSAFAQEVVNGSNVKYVQYSSSKSTSSGYFMFVSAGTWREQDLFNNEHFFKETKRDNGTLYLLDAERGISMMIDLLRKKIVTDWDKPNKGKLYKIVRATACLIV